MNIGAILETLLSPLAPTYPHMMSDAATLPAIVYQEISATPLHAMRADAGITRVRVQVSAFANTYSEARTLGNSMASVLSRYKSSASGVIDTLLDDDTMQYDLDAKCRQVIQDYTFFLSR